MNFLWQTNFFNFDSLLIFLLPFSVQFNLFKLNNVLIFLFICSCGIKVPDGDFVTELGTDIFERALSGLRKEANMIE